MTRSPAASPRRLASSSAWFAGSIASLTVLAAPDLITLTLTEFAEQALRINRACTLPLLVDADHGYGNALNVMRTVEELEIAGVSALSLEDTELPRPYGAPRPRLITLEEGVAKIEAGLAARVDPGLAILARTGACSITGLEDALVRARAYCATGADGLFLTGVTTREQLDALAEVATLADHPGHAEPGHRRPGLSDQPRGSHRPARPPADPGRDGGGARHSAGAARRPRHRTRSPASRQPRSAEWRRARRSMRRLLSVSSEDSPAP